MSFPGCTYVLTQRGPLQISDVTGEDCVLTGEGTYCPVLGVKRERGTKRTLYSVDVSYTPLLVTHGEQKFLAISSQDKDEPTWVAAKHLTTDSYLGIPNREEGIYATNGVIREAINSLLTSPYEELGRFSLFQWNRESLGKLITNLPNQPLSGESGRYLYYSLRGVGLIDLNGNGQRIRPSSSEIRIASGRIFLKVKAISPLVFNDPLFSLLLNENSSYSVEGVIVKA